MASVWTQTTELGAPMSNFLFLHSQTFLRFPTPSHSAICSRPHRDKRWLSQKSSRQCPRPGLPPSQLHMGAHRHLPSNKGTCPTLPALEPFITGQPLRATAQSDCPQSLEETCQYLFLRVERGSKQAGGCGHQAVLALLLALKRRNWTHKDVT